MDHIDRAADKPQRETLCVTLVPLFQGLSYDQQRDVAALARPLQIAKGQQVYAPGSEVSQLMVVHTGRVKIARLSREGHEQIARVLEPGDFVGESAFVTGGRPDHFATALEAGSMCVFRHADLGRLVEQHPSIGMRMLHAVTRRLEETEARLASVISRDVSARLASYLLSLPAHHAGGKLEVRLPLAKKDIASLLDTTPESLSRQLRRLQESGVITQQNGQRIVILDIDALMGLSVPD